MLLSPIITIFLGMQIMSISQETPKAWLGGFKNFPYLYKGTDKEAQEYFFDYFSCNEQSVVVEASVDNKLVGFITGMPLRNTHIQGVDVEFQNSNLQVNQFYYLSDAVVLEAYRKKGIAKKLLVTFEEKVKSLGYSKICLATCEREENHPLKPSNYVVNDAWNHLGFIKTIMKTKQKWDTIIDENDNAESQENPLVFWVKDLQ